MKLFSFFFSFIQDTFLCHSVTTEGNGKGEDNETHHVWRLKNNILLKKVVS